MDPRRTLRRVFEEGKQERWVLEKWKLGVLGLALKERGGSAWKMGAVQAELEKSSSSTARSISPLARITMLCLLCLHKQ